MIIPIKPMAEPAKSSNPASFLLLRIISLSYVLAGIKFSIKLKTHFILWQLVKLSIHYIRFRNNPVICILHILKQWRKGKAKMEAQVASLLLIVASVAFSCVVVGFAAAAMEQTLVSANDSNSQINQRMESIMNQTSSLLNDMQDQAFNQTTPIGP